MCVCVCVTCTVILQVHFFFKAEYLIDTLSPQFGQAGYLVNFRNLLISEFLILRLQSQGNITAVFYMGAVI